MTASVRRCKRYVVSLEQGDKGSIQGGCNVFRQGIHRCMRGILCRVGAYVGMLKVV